MRNIVGTAESIYDLLDMINTIKSKAKAEPEIKFESNLTDYTAVVFYDDKTNTIYIK